MHVKYTYHEGLLNRYHNDIIWTFWFILNNITDRFYYNIIILDKLYLHGKYLTKLK